MYQNFNCCSSDWMERTKYIQGRSGTKSKDCLPFVQYYKCLENKIENKNIQHLHLCPDCPSSHPIRKFLPISQIPSSLPPKIPDSFSLREASSKSLQAEPLPVFFQYPKCFYPFTAYRTLCHHSILGLQRDI